MCMGPAILAYFCEMAARAWDVIFFFGRAVALDTLIVIKQAD